MPKKRRRRRNPAQCPCGQDASYATCCGPLHRGERGADGPVELMRSRYAAYARGEVDYIIETTDPMGEAWQEPASTWRADIRKFGRDMNFEGVDILDVDVDQEAGTGRVRFRAKLRSNGRDASFVEASQFVRRDGRWLYTSGSVEPAT